MRHTLTALVIALLAGLTQLLAAPSAGACPQTVVIGVDGTGSVGHTPSLVTQHADQFVAEGAELVRVDYPGSIWPLGPYPYDQSRAAGVAATKQAITDAHRRCPNAHIHGISHSQGASVVPTAMRELENEGTVPGDQMSFDAFSDPQHPGQGIEIVLPGLLPGYSMLGERDMKGSKIKQHYVCVQGDPVCDFPEVFQDPLGVVDAPLGYWYKHGYYIPDGTEIKSGETIIPAGPMIGYLPPEEERQIPFAPKVQDVIDYEVAPLPDVPPLPNFTEPYVERPLSTYIPDEVEQFVPPQVNNYVPPPVPQLPPVPALPQLPVIELPPLPALPAIPPLF